MAAPALALSSLTIAGTDYKNVLQSGTIEIDSEIARNDSVVDGGQSNQTTKLMARITASLMSTLTAPDRVSGLDMSALTLGGVDLLALGMGNLAFNIGYGRTERPNAGSIFKYPQNTTKSLSGTVSVAASDAGVLPFYNELGTDDPADKVVSLSFTINSVATTCPVLLKSVSTPYERDGLQIVEVGYESRIPTSGAYPSAPTGTTTLYEKALNAFRTAVTITADAATAGTRVTGDFIFEPSSLEVRDGALIPVNYAWVNQGEFEVSTIS